MSLNRVIGHGNRIPWHLPDDFRWFKKMTMGQTIVMGRKTFESIGKPLPGRTTVVLTRSGFSWPGVRTIARLDQLDLECEAGELFICGGSEVYKQALSRCSDLYLTLVDRTVNGDRFFPEFEDEFELRDVIERHEDFQILHYKNRSVAASCDPESVKYLPSRPGL